MPRGTETDLRQYLLDNSRDEECPVPHLVGNCRVWTGARLPKGYGTLRWNGFQLYAHRASHAAFKEEIQEGFQCQHLCNNPPCIQPAHLITGDGVQNSEYMRDCGRGAQVLFLKDVEEIKVALVGGEAARELAARYETSYQAIAHIRCLDSWSSIRPDLNAALLALPPDGGPGELHYNAKITEKQALEVMRLLNEGMLTHKEIVQRLGIPLTIIETISSGRSWTHLGSVIPIKIQRPPYSLDNKVSELMDQHLSNKEIAYHLGIPRYTVNDICARLRGEREARAEQAAYYTAHPEMKLRRI